MISRDFLLDGFYVDKVRITALAVWRTARNNDNIAFFHQTALFSELFCEIEQDINRSVFIRHSRQNAPA